MAADNITGPAVVVAAPPGELTVFDEVKRFLRTKPLGTAGAIILVLMVVMAIFASIIAPHDPYLIRQDKLFITPFSSAEFILGTDDMGRDLASRLIYGARISLYVGLLSTLLGSVVGAFLGLAGGYWGGWIDNIIQRFMDILLAFPMLVLAMAVVASLGPSANNVIIAIAAVMLPRSARVLRSSTLSTKEMLYVEAAKVTGCSNWRISLRHVLPNCLSPFIILVTAQLGGAILIEASLSFLGLGVPPPEPSWGAMLTGAARFYVYKAPWMAILPGVAISLAVFGFNLFGDALRDIFDPRLRA
jgi:peptide/nickel transport system permease protein